MKSHAGGRERVWCEARMRKHSIRRTDGKREMDERNLRKRVMKYTIIIGLISAVIIGCSAVVVMAVRKAEEQSYTAYVDSLVNEYRLRFEERMNSDFETLEFLSELIEDDLLSVECIVRDEIRNLSDNCSFFKISFYDVDAEQDSVLIPGSDSKYKFSNRPEEAQEAIRKAWEGEKSISEVYVEDGRPILSFAVPVYREGNVWGAVTGLEELDRFQAILNGSTLSGDRINMFWTQEDGTVIAASSEESFAEEGAAVIRDAIQHEYAKENLENVDRQRVRWEEETYTLYHADVGTNGWALFYIDNGKDVHSPISSMIVVVGAAFAILFLACATVIIYNYKTSRKNIQRIRLLAETDPLTGIDNMSKFQQEAEKLLKESREYCMAVIDFRHFRYINDIFGRDQADQLLGETALLLLQSVKEKERCCRNKGDQFYLLLEADKQENLRARLLKLMDEISGLAAAFHKNYGITLYCGAAVENEECEPETQYRKLLAHAEFAMRMRKNGHENDVAFYDKNMHDEKHMNMMIESSKQEALENGEFRLYLQAKKNLAAGEIAGAEALVRWIRPDGTMIFPDRFIPVFERNGFCAKLDLHMVELVCRAQRRWLDMGLEIFPVSVNQSKLLFYQEDYIERLCEITDRYQVPRKYLVLEILEGLAAENMEALNTTILRLKENGFQISMDDFGSGYSSLNILAGLEIDEVKLDREFLFEMGSDREEKQKTMMRNVVQMARDFRIRTVAEGVETLENEEFLQEIHCDYGQGYYYSRPIPVDVFEEKFLRGKRREYRKA